MNGGSTAPVRQARVDLRQGKRNLRQERVDLRQERVDLRQETVDLRQALWTYLLLSQCFAAQVKLLK